LTRADDEIGCDFDNENDMVVPCRHAWRASRFVTMAEDIGDLDIVAYATGNFNIIVLEHM